MEINIWKEKGIETNGVRVGLSKIKELSKSSIKTACAITVCPQPLSLEDLQIDQEFQSVPYGLVCK